MNTIKFYLIYGFLYAIAVSVILAIGYSILEKSVILGVQQLSLGMFILLFSGGIVVAYVDRKLAKKV